MGLQRAWDVPTKLKPDWAWQEQAGAPGSAQVRPVHFDAAAL